MYSSTLVYPIHASRLFTPARWARFTGFGVNLGRHSGLSLASRALLFLTCRTDDPMTLHRQFYDLPMSGAT